MSTARRNPFTRTAAVALAALLASACAAGEDDPFDKDDEYGMDGPVEPTPPPGKEDSIHRRGLAVQTDTRRTQVWSAKNRWEDRDTPAARAAGLAWGEDSGLSWDEKYAVWLDSLERVASPRGYDTFRLTTPWGKTLTSPVLECAEMSMFLRISFAAWYQLPFFMEAVDQHGARIYFGHNGVRTASGRYASTPEYAIKYADHGALAEAEWRTRWPSDASLRRRSMGNDDQQVALDGEPGFGAYLDEIHLNKRVGHFTMLALNYLGSVNLADSANTYNIVPEAVRAGDTLLERWQRVGIGHTLVVKEVAPLEGGALDVTLVSGSMPRRQAKWESGVASKRYFTDPTTGGEGTASDGTPYARLGGGLKRWRVTKDVGGFWTNTFMSADEAHWINSTDHARIAARPAQFDSLLGSVPPEQLRDALVELVEDARRHLRNFPASCAARERREKAFSELYDVMEREFATDRLAVDREYRKDEDYVFAELEYEKSKTCCWNSTNATMAEIVLAAHEADQAEADAAGECRPPVVFMSQADGYERWRRFAEAQGQGAAWRPWSEDEPCAQRAVPSDTERAHEWTEFCALGEAPGEPGGGDGDCGDALEPSDAPASAPEVSGSVDGLEICVGDVDYYRGLGGRTVRIEFSHAAGDLDLETLDAAGAAGPSSAGTTDVEQVTVPDGGTLKVLGWNGATGAYRLIVE